MAQMSPAPKVTVIAGRSLRLRFYTPPMYGQRARIAGKSSRDPGNHARVPDATFRLGLASRLGPYDHGESDSRRRGVVCLR